MRVARMTMRSRLGQGGLTLFMALAAPASVWAQPSTPPQLTQSPQCDLPFPHDALAQAPAGFVGTAVVLVSLNVKGEFRSGRLLSTSGNEALDDAALRAAVGVRCQPLGDVKDPNLQEALIGIPFAYTFDNSRGSGPAESLPVR